MNMMLLRPDELGRPLPLSDPRTRHVLKVLKKSPGDSLLAGLEGRSSGTALILGLDAEGMRLTYSPSPEPPEPLRPLRLILGFPRPIQARRILKDLCSLGLERIVLCASDLGEASYRQSDFYSREEWRDALREGAAQAANPLMPEVYTAGSIEEGIGLSGGAGMRIALDNQTGVRPLSSFDPVRPAGALLAVGSERGWSDRERAALARAGFASAGLGPRVLRTETACLAASAICLARMGDM
jgi:RsmE family RNA methyltransferase